MNVVRRLRRNAEVSYIQESECIPMGYQGKDGGPYGSVYAEVFTLVVLQTRPSIYAFNTSENLH